MTRVPLTLVFQNVVAWIIQGEQLYAESELRSLNGDDLRVFYARTKQVCDIAERVIIERGEVP
jgi:hypothetical protein